MATRVPSKLVLKCVQREHWWGPYNPLADEYQGPGWGVSWHEQCEHCHSFRHNTMDNLGNIYRYYVQSREFEAALQWKRESTENFGDIRLAYARSMRLRLDNLAKKPSRNGRS